MTTSLTTPSIESLPATAPPAEALGVQVHRAHQAVAQLASHAAAPRPPAASPQHRVTLAERVASVDAVFAAFARQREEEPLGPAAE